MSAAPINPSVDGSGVSDTAPVVLKSRIASSGPPVDPGARLN
jgi:hypothetical protein